ncbi:MAG: hypothetical protein GWP61_22625 [Chloroflexi bacterium]|jgi:hypothetical protein|nr:hypothetical protein [Chloroflexota bacterium]
MPGTRYLIPVCEAMNIDKLLDIVVAVRKMLGQILEETYYHGDAFIIERAGLPMAAVISIERYRQWQKNREDFLAMIDEVQSRSRDVLTHELESAVNETASKTSA